MIRSRRAFDGSAEVDRMLMSLIASRHSVYVPPLRLDWSTARKGWTWTNPFGVGVVARTLPGAAAVPDGTMPDREVISPDGVHTALIDRRTSSTVCTPTPATCCEAQE